MRGEGPYAELLEKTGLAGEDRLDSPKRHAARGLAVDLDQGVPPLDPGGRCRAALGHRHHQGDAAEQFNHRTQLHDPPGGQRRALHGRLLFGRRSAELGDLVEALRKGR